MFRELTDRPLLAEALTQLGDHHHAAGDHHDARAAWTEAAGILEDIQHPDAAHVRAKLPLAELAAQA